MRDDPNAARDREATPRPSRARPRRIAATAAIIGLSAAAGLGLSGGDTTVVALLLGVSVSLGVGALARVRPPTTNLGAPSVPEEEYGETPDDPSAEALREAPDCPAEDDPATRRAATPPRPLDHLLDGVSRSFQGAEDGTRQGQASLRATMLEIDEEGRTTGGSWSAILPPDPRCGTKGSTHDQRVLPLVSISSSLRRAYTEGPNDRPRADDEPPRRGADEHAPVVIAFDARATTAPASSEGRLFNTDDAFSAFRRAREDHEAP